MFVLVGHDQYEDSYVLGVYETLEAAQQEVPLYIARAEESELRWLTNCHRHDFYDVYWVVAGSPARYYSDPVWSYKGE